MGKFTRSPITSGYRSYQKFNENLAAIEDAIQDTLSRTGSTPNQMEATLDMNSNKIINLAAPGDVNDAARLQDVLDYAGSGGGGGGAVSWSSITGKPSTFTPTTENVQDIVGAQITAGSGINVAYNDSTGAVTITNASEGGAGAIPPLSEFGAIDSGGVNTTSNDAAITAAEASAYDRIWIPEGVYATTKTKADLTKGYEGPGIFLIASSNALPGRFSQITTAPTLWATQGATGWFRGDQKFAEGEYKVIGPGTRQKTDARYFESAYIPHHAWLDIYDGGSGVLARLASTASTGSNTIVVDAIDSADVLGRVIAFSNTPDGVAIETRTVTAVVGTTLTLNSPPSSNYATGTVIYTSRRTWAGYQYVRVNHYAEGDGYGYIVRTNVYNPAKGGQRHVFEAGTGAQFGGDINFQSGSGGKYATGWESYYADQGNDVAVIAQVDTFVRDNDTGGKSAMWLGTLFKSEGTKPADAAHVVKGKWRVGLDLTGADLSNFATAGDNLNVGINMALGQKIYLNSSQSTGARTGSSDYGTFIGNTLGDIVFESGNDINGDYVQWEFKRSPPNNGRIRLRPASFNVSVQANFGASMNATTDASVGASGKYEFGLGSGNYLLMIGTELYFRKAAGTFHLIV